MIPTADQIRAIPGVIERVLADGAAETARAADGVTRARPRWAATLSRRGSAPVAIYTRYLLATCLGIATGSSAPSVTTVYRAPIDWRGGLLIAVSRTGEEDDLASVVTEARIGGAVTVAVTGDPSARLADAAEHALLCEVGTTDAATAYVAQLTAVAAFVAHARPSSPVGPSLVHLPDVLARCVVPAERWVDSSGAVESAVNADRWSVLSRGYNLATALETAWLLSAVGRLPTTACSAADVAAADLGPEARILVFRPDGEMGRSVDEAIARLTAHGSPPWVVGGFEAGTTPVDGHRRGERRTPLALPLDLPEVLTPPALVLPGALLAEGVALARGIGPDHPVWPDVQRRSAAERGRRRS